MCFYVRYWHGFRIYVRALLSVMDYGTMRTLIMWTFFLLMAAVTAMLALKTRSVWPPVLFAAGILFVNPVVASALFQYSLCFVIAFIGMLFVPKWQKNPQSAWMGFMILGMSTMFFDFYTAPLLTLGLPLLGWLICDNYSAAPAPAKKQALRSLKAVGVWVWFLCVHVACQALADHAVYGSERVPLRLGVPPSCGWESSRRRTCSSATAR